MMGVLAQGSRVLRYRRADAAHHPRGEGIGIAGSDRDTAARECREVERRWAPQRPHIGDVC
jgi:hypothetical protein